MKVHIIFESKTPNFNQLNSSISFIKKNLNNDIIINFIDIMENRKELKTLLQNKEIDRANLVCVVEINNNLFPFYTVVDAIDFVITNSNTVIETKIKKVDTVIFGSGIASLTAAFELSKNGQQVIILDNGYFGRSLVTDGINIDNPFINEIYSPIILNTFLKENSIDIFTHHSVTSTVINSIEKSNGYNIAVGELFSIETTNILIGDVLTPKLLKIQNEDEMIEQVIFNITDRFNELVNKKVVIIGDYEIEPKLKILNKIAKKVTHVSLNESKSEPIRIFEKDGEISALLVKHIAGYSKPIKCEAIVYSTGYEPDKSFEFINTIKDTSNLFTTDNSSSNMIDLAYKGREIALKILQTNS